jgi:acyl-CoA thioester hydrolase
LTPEIFQIELKVEKEHIDALDHVNNLVYLTWAQEVARQHWNSKASKELARSIVWVVTRHEIDYRKPAFLEDILQIKTWVLPPEGVAWPRMVHIEKQGKLLAKAKTNWCPVSADNQRLMRLSPEMLAVLSDDF